MFVKYPIDNIPQGWVRGASASGIQRDGKLGRHQITQIKEGLFMGAVGFYNGARFPIYNRQQSEEFTSIGDAIIWCDSRSIE